MDHPLQPLFPHAVALDLAHGHKYSPAYLAAANEAHELFNRELEREAELYRRAHVDRMTPEDIEAARLARLPEDGTLDHLDQFDLAAGLSADSLRKLVAAENKRERRAEKRKRLAERLEWGAL